MQIKQFLESLSLAIVAGLCAVIWKQVLAYKLPFINKFFQWGDKFNKRWFYKPIWGCSQCFAGQFALWAYLLTHFMPVISWDCGLLEDFSMRVAISPTSLQYSLIGHILAIAGAIYLSTIFTYQFNRAEHGGN